MKIKPFAVFASLIGLSTFVSAPVMAQTNSYPTQTSPATQEMQNNTNTGSANANLVELAAGNDSFTTLAAAVKAAGLDNTLANQGTYTIFAPTDEAFAALPPGALDLLLQPENRELLRKVLTYHVVAGEVTASELSTGPVKTIGGGVAVRVTDDRVIVNNASVIQPNIQASNGVIHAVNRVLLPRELRQQLVSQLSSR